MHLNPASAPLEAVGGPADVLLHKRGLVERLLVFLRGYDLFISYRRDPSARYVMRLASQLAKKGLLCHYDLLDTEPTPVLPNKVKTAIRRSTHFVLIGSEEALGSESIKAEVREFRKVSDKRNILLVDVDKALDEGKLKQNEEWQEWAALIPGLPRTLADSRAAVERGRPSRDVLRGLYDATKFTRRSRKTLRVFWLTLAAIVALSAGAGFIVYRAYKSADEAASQAREARHLAVRAGEELRAAEVARDTARDEARKAGEEARKQGEEAGRQREESQRQKEAADGFKEEADQRREEARQLGELAEDRRKEIKRGSVRFYEEQGRQELLRGNATGGLVYLSRAYHLTTQQPTLPEDHDRPSLKFLLAWAGLPFAGQLASLNGHEHRVTSASFDGEGRRVITVSEDGTAKVWEAATGRLLANLSPDHLGPVLGARFSPNGKHILTVSRDLVRADGGDPQELDHERIVADLWDGESYARVKRKAEFLEKDEFVLEEPGDTWDNDWRAICFDDKGGRFGVWLQEEENGEEVYKVFESTTGAEVPSFEGTLPCAPEPSLPLPPAQFRLLKADSGPRKILSSNKIPVRSVRLLVEGRGRLLLTLEPDDKSAGKDTDKDDDGLYKGPLGVSVEKTDAVLVNEAGGAPRVLKDHAAPVTFATFSRDGKYVATTSADRTAMVWDAENGAPLASLRGHENKVISAAFSEDGDQIVTAGEDNRAIVWKWKDVKGPVLKRLEGGGHVAFFTPATGGPGTERIFAAGDDGDAYTWDAATYADVTLAEPKGERNMAVSSDGARMITRGEGGFKLWDTATGKRLTAFRPKDAVKVAFSQNGKYIVATISDDGEAQQPVDILRVRVWDAATGKRHRGETEALGEADTEDAVAVSSDGNRILVAVSDRLQMWLAETGAMPASDAGDGAAHSGRVLFAMFSPDDRYVVTAGEDKLVKLWDAAAAKGVHPLPLLYTFPGHTATITSATFSPDQTRLVTTSEDGTAKVWDVKSGQLLFNCAGHTEGVNSAAFSRDGLRLATTSGDDTVKIWDAKTGVLLASLEEHDAGVFSAAFDADGQRLVTTDGTGTTRVWDVHLESGKASDINQRVRRVSRLALVNDQLLPAVQGGRAPAAGGKN